MMVVTVSIAVLYSTFYFVSVGGKTLFALWVWAIFFCFCANFVLLPTATAQCFGTRYIKVHLAARIGHSLLVLCVFQIFF